MSAQGRTHGRAGRVVVRGLGPVALVAVTLLLAACSSGAPSPSPSGGVSDTPGAPSSPGLSSPVPAPSVPQDGTGAGEGGPVEAVLVLDVVNCRNNGTVAALGEQWQLVDAAPQEWRDVVEHPGSLTVVGEQLAEFTAEDGTVLVVTTGFRTQQCVTWDPM